MVWWHLMLFSCLSNGLNEKPDQTVVHEGLLRHACPAAIGSSGVNQHKTKEVRRLPESTNIFDEKPDFDTIGGRLSRARESAGLDIKGLAWRLGVGDESIRDWETDRSQPDARLLTKMAGLLNVSLSWILHGVGTSPDEPDEPVLIESVGTQLDRLKHLNVETGHLITRLESDLERLRQPVAFLDYAP
ncbi:helix-turn-helix transcriptional regulator [Mesorhizobium sp. CN2-181]|uniref:helix-turn-helix domain-containing protein n=1 Tax=Mesorhizobium yinganensis TaxID=3157707 RepID=UPI0032B854BE